MSKLLFLITFILLTTGSLFAIEYQGKGRLLDRSSIRRQNNSPIPRIILTGEYNLYTMVKNDPISYWDYLGLSKFSSGIRYCERPISDNKWLEDLSPDHAYILSNKPIFPDLAYPDATRPKKTKKKSSIGWAGSIYNEKAPTTWDKTPKARECWDTERLETGELPDGTPCKCATKKDIQDCLVKNRNFCKKEYGTLTYNCKDWAKDLLKKCCLKIGKTAKKKASK